MMPICTLALLLLTASQATDGAAPRRYEFPPLDPLLPQLQRGEAARRAERKIAPAPDAVRQTLEPPLGARAELLAEVEAIAREGSDQEQVEALERFAAAHPGTTAAAKAIFYAAFTMHVDTLGTFEPHGADPTSRFMRVLQIVRELESGKYPPSHYTGTARDLIIDFYIPHDAKIPPENVERIAASLADYACDRIWLVDNDEATEGVGLILTWKIPDLLGRLPNAAPRIERLFDDVERRVPDPSVIRYLRAVSYLIGRAWQSAADHAALRRKSFDVLAALSGEGTGLYHRYALSTLAMLHFDDGNYSSARDAFRRYWTRYPDSDWAWAAQLRTGQCEEKLGNPTAAVQVLREAASRYSGLPLAAVLAHEYMARAFEALGKFDDALAAHERALAAWDDRYGDRYDLAVGKEEVSARISVLRRSLASTGGAAVERGRWLLEQFRYDEAVRVLRAAAASRPRSRIAEEARYLANRARLERALDAADVEGAGVHREAITALTALTREPHDVAVALAAIAQASIAWKHGDAGAERMMRDALEAWHSHQRITPPADPFERDVAAIRRALFLPHGGHPYGVGGWNAFSWPVPPPPFFLVNADVPVITHDGGVTRVKLVQQFATPTRVLVADTEQLELLKRILVKLGGTWRREPEHIMETPNQPVGDSMRILELWRKFFPARPGHWSGWEMETYPVIRRIRFLDASRTRATAEIVIGYSGATVELEKRKEGWRATRLTNQWVT